MKTLAYLGFCLTVFILSAPKDWAQAYRILHHFPAQSGATGTPLVSDGIVYGITARGGPADDGTVYRISTTGEDFTVLHEFSGSDGQEPRAGLVRSGNTLYGTTLMGGLFGGGTVFKIQTNGSGFEVLKHFNPWIGEGEQPTGSEPMVLLNGTLFGMTQYSGATNGVAFGWGTAFRLQTDGTGHQVLKQFPAGVESTPWSGLALDGITLYGTTSGWAGANLGTVFRLNTDGSGYRTLWQFTGGTDAAFPLGGVVVAGNTLFGTTYYGPGNLYHYSGTVFRMNTDGTGFTTLHVFDSRAYWPREGLLLADGVLYGPVICGPGDVGSGVGSGAIYALTTNGFAFQFLKQFDGTNGSSPCGVALSGDRLYGACWGGGTENGGVLYTLSTPSPKIVTGPCSQTAELGNDVWFMVQAEGAPTLSYELFFNQTNWLFSSMTNRLRLPQVQFEQTGTYTIRVSNQWGAMATAPFELNVIPAVVRRTVPGIKLNGVPGDILRLEISPNLIDPFGWRLLDNISLTNATEWYFDTTTPLDFDRFYRAAYTNASLPPLPLDISLIPAITLSGTNGSTLRLDFINQFGPTDNWSTLAMVTLTSTTQLFLDTTAPGQPKRLYRIVTIP